MKTIRLTIDKSWDDNERTREGKNGRLYTRTAGRWVWTVTVDDEARGAYDTRGEAAERAAALAAEARGRGAAVAGPGAVWRAPTAPDAARARLALAKSAHATTCTACGRHVSTTDDWTLYPWPDGAALCNACNDERHDREEYPG